MRTEKTVGLISVIVGIACFITMVVFHLNGLPDVLVALPVVVAVVTLFATLIIIGKLEEKRRRQKSE